MAKKKKKRDTVYMQYKCKDGSVTVAAAASIGLMYWYEGAGLANAIAANPSNVEAALAAYEMDIFPRSASEAAGAEVVLEMCYGDNAPQSLVDFFTNTRLVH